MACPKHVVNCPDRDKNQQKQVKVAAIPGQPTTTTIDGVVYLVKPKKND